MQGACFLFFRLSVHLQKDKMANCSCAIWKTLFLSFRLCHLCELVAFTLGKRQDRKETGNGELRMAGNEPFCQSGRSLGAPNIPG